MSDEFDLSTPEGRLAWEKAKRAVLAKREVADRPAPTRTFDGRSDAEESLFRQMQWAKLPQPAREFRFHPARNWRFDFAWLDLKLAVEVEGGTHSGGRHTRGRGFEEDCEKYAEAVILGWSILRVTTAMVNDGRALKYVERAIERSKQ